MTALETWELDNGGFGLGEIKGVEKKKQKHEVSEVVTEKRDTPVVPKKKKPVVSDDELIKDYKHRVVRNMKWGGTTSETAKPKKKDEDLIGVEKEKDVASGMVQVKKGKTVNPKKKVSEVVMEKKRRNPLFLKRKSQRCWQGRI